ncbi:hypothetical protein BKA58DRAFT_435968 [Alternaria rosae]|uniref:uncharacterized protein n=1 Tax=Alternaria rosae TaxID=1187941 RepID=UPI001E8CF31C|nr:uncharacterized protein BKA58DRAFT_435968 [Alternaria rosae]KAH6878265.1 hypothetical protein BKA58DRAFT_435968 [Alternaria rosae]
MPLISITTANSSTAGYKLLSPYTDDDTTFAHNTLCPRYAESDPTSAPPSPASVESFEILDSIPWRRGYIALDNHGRQSGNTLRSRWMRNKVRAMVLLLLLTLLVAGCVLGGYMTIKHGKSKSSTDAA